MNIPVKDPPKYKILRVPSNTKLVTTLFTPGNSSSIVSGLNEFVFEFHKPT